MRNLRKKITVEIVANFLGLAAVILWAGNLVLQWLLPGRQITELVNQYGGNMAPELFGIWITITIIDRLNQKHNLENLKRLLISQMNSEHNILTSDAVRRIRDEGWIDDLEKTSITYANLEDVALYNFNFRNSRITYTKLKNANLNGVVLDGAVIDETELDGASFHGASLRNVTIRSVRPNYYLLKDVELIEADLTGAKFLSVYNEEVTDDAHLHLQTARCMRGCIMPDGKRYDGRYELAGDLLVAESNNIDAGDPQSMAEFYEVSVEEYQSGKEWFKNYDKKYKWYFL